MAKKLLFSPFKFLEKFNRRQLDSKAHNLKSTLGSRTVCKVTLQENKLLHGNVILIFSQYGTSTYIHSVQARCNGECSKKTATDRNKAVHI